MEEAKRHILLIGAGRMGGALLTAWTHKHTERSGVTVLEKDAAQAKKLEAEGAVIVSSLGAVTTPPDCIVLAVKPQSMDALLGDLSSRFPDSSLRRGEVGRGADSHRYPIDSIVQNARTLRQNMTDAEQILWKILRSEQLGVKFRKQYPIGNYIADFACLGLKLIIELDGGQHGQAENIKRDEERTRFIEQQGFRVLRFWNNDVAKNPEGVIQVIRAAIEERNHFNSPHPNPPPMGEGVPLYLSIAAGKTLAYFEKHLGHVPVVRAMPNTPALIRKGITALCANANVSEPQKALAEDLLRAAGEVVWLDDESQMDAVTAVSGSGPAYVFLFLEALIEAGVAQGLTREMARTLALHTLRGSAKLAMKSDEPMEELRKHVTSPGGTTEAALKVLMHEDRFSLLFQEAVAAAVRRAKELS